MVALQPSIDDDNTGEDSDNKYGTGRSRYLALKERRSRLARSRSSHLMGNDDEDIIDQPVSPTTASPNAYLASRFDFSRYTLRNKKKKNKKKLTYTLPVFFAHVFISVYAYFQDRWLYCIEHTTCCASQELQNGDYVCPL